MIAVKRRQADYSVQLGNETAARRQREDADRIERLWICKPLLTPRAEEDSTESMSRLQRQVRDRLETLSEGELNLVNQYLSFLEFQRGAL